MVKREEAVVSVSSVGGGGDVGTVGCNVGDVKGSQKICMNKW